MMKRKICGFVLAAFLIVVANAYADETLQQKLNGAWETSNANRHGVNRTVIHLDFQGGTFEEKFFFDEVMYQKRVEDNPALTRELFQPEYTGTFKIVSETGNSMICDFLYDQGLAITLAPQENGDLKFFGGLALTGRAEAVKHHDKFFTYTPLKDNKGLDGVWVTRESGQTLALIINQARKPDPETTMIGAGNILPEPDTDWNAVKGDRIDGYLNILSVNDGLTAARFDKWRTRETLTLNPDGTLFLTSAINNDNMYTRVKADQ